MVDTTDLDHLISTCRELESSPGKLTDADVHTFFSDFSMERIFRALASAGSQDPIALVSDMLGRLLSTDLGASMLPSSLPYLEAAATAPLPPLRRLAAEQYGKLLLTLAARQQGRTFTGNMHTSAANGASDSQEAEAASLQLVRMLVSDQDTGVAVAAAGALRRYGSTGPLALRRLLAPGSAAVEVLSGAAAGRDAAVRMRVLSLALELVSTDSTQARAGAGGSSGASTDFPVRTNGHHVHPQPLTASTPGAVSTAVPTTAAVGEEDYEERLELLRRSGLLEPLLRQLADASDPLACLAALQLLEDMMAGSGGGAGSDGADGGGGEGVAAALAGVALPQILDLISEPMLADAALPLVASIVRHSLPAALPPAAVAAAAVAAAADVTAAAQPPLLTAPSSSSSWPPVLRVAPALLSAVRAVLDDRGNASAAAEASGLDALGTLGQSREGAQLVMTDGELVKAVCERALGRCPHPEVRLAGLHAVASLSGLERAGWERSREAAILPMQCEEALRGGIFEVCGPSRKRPGEVLLGLLEQPFVEMRLAAYRCLAALSLRSWFAVELVTTSSLLDHICNADSETGAAGCGWRHAAAAALWATVSAASCGELGLAEAPYTATLAAPALVDRLRTAVQGGPFGAGRNGGGGGPMGQQGAHDQHFVATRGGGGGV